ncbi:MAG: hypothetical protein ACI318_05900 [Bacilli bacterium]
MVIKKFNEIIDEVEIGIKEGTIKKTTQPKIYELIIKRFANFFGVSILSARIRLKELGLNFVEGILSYIDGGYIKSFSFKKETLRNNQSYTIPTPNLISLINSNQDLQDKLVNESIIYTNKMLVVNDPKYVNNKTYKLTSYALEHAEECCLRFNVQRMGRGLNGEYSEKFFLYSYDKNNKLIINNGKSLVYDSSCPFKLIKAGTFDFNGNQLTGHEYTYLGRNISSIRIVETNISLQFAYDYKGRRIQKNDIQYIYFNDKLESEIHTSYTLKIYV